MNKRITTEKEKEQILNILRDKGEITTSAFGHLKDILDELEKEGYITSKIKLFSKTYTLNHKKEN